jgi:hypothetical protein
VNEWAGAAVVTGFDDGVGTGVGAGVLNEGWRSGDAAVTDGADAAATEGWRDEEEGVRDNTRVLPETTVNSGERKCRSKQGSRRKSKLILLPRVSKLVEPVENLTSASKFPVGISVNIRWTTLALDKDGCRGSVDRAGGSVPCSGG